MIRYVLTAALLVAVPATAAFAKDSADGEKPAAEKKVCRTENKTGSMFARRVCHTHAEWEAIDAAAREQAHHDRDGVQGGVVH